MRRWLHALLLTLLIGPLTIPSAAAAAAEDWDIAKGHFFTQTGGGGSLGYSVTNDRGVRFWSEFQRLGGVPAVGYPASQRFEWDGFIVQVFQRVIFQWRPRSAAVTFVNVLDRLDQLGKNDWLQQVRQTPPPKRWNEAGLSWGQIVQRRLAVLDAYPAMRAAYFNVVGNAIQARGLPTSAVVDQGNHYALRAQRVVLQQWKEDVPWAKAGQVTIAFGGDIAKEAGVLPSTSLTPIRADAGASVPGRSLVDRPDDSTGAQIHVMYVLPSDGVDNQLDVTGAIATSVGAFEKWLAGQSGGSQLRLDTFHGSLDVTFFRLSRTDAQIRSYRQFVRDQIEQELRASGFNSPNKLYAVYYGGGSDFACGGGAWPPTLVGTVAAVYLLGTPPGAPPCSTNSLASSVDTPGYFDYSMIHEIMHTLGFVASCAPHFTRAGHASDDPRDLMYAGPLPWYPSILDIGHDDYFQHNITGCLDLAKSAFLDPTAPGATYPPSWPFATSVRPP